MLAMPEQTRYPQMSSPNFNFFHFYIYSVALSVLQRLLFCYLCNFRFRYSCLTTAKYRDIDVTNKMKNDSEFGLWYNSWQKFGISRKSSITNERVDEHPWWRRETVPSRVVPGRWHGPQKEPPHRVQLLNLTSTHRINVFEKNSCPFHAETKYWKSSWCKTF